MCHSFRHLDNNRRQPHHDDAMQKTKKFSRNLPHSPQRMALHEGQQ
jgi:hypothetical protein